MANRYFFDKRDMKHFFIKYGILLLIAFFIIIGVNVFLTRVDRVGRIFIDLAIILVVVLVGEMVYNAIERRREAKREARQQEKNAKKK